MSVSFFRPLGSASTLRTSVVQAFDENGERLMLRGHYFHWDEGKQGRAPHLSGEMAGELIGMVLRRYQAERGQSPRRVVVLLGDQAYRSARLWEELAERTERRPATRQQVEVCFSALKRAFGLGETSAKTVVGLVTSAVPRRKWPHTYGLYVNRLLRRPQGRIK